ncbi:MAG: TetR/AcrR family transcriptional regulator, partial [Clostridiaceae bacterium]|nr:TetR/AcrR family transcriptional regulator [Clostridiaceae bacterium]
VGVTKGALYAYFESREVLFREMTLEVFTRVRSELEKAFRESGDGPETFSRITDLVYGDLKRYTNIFIQMVTTVPQDPELQKIYSTMFDRNVTFIGGHISRMQKKGMIPVEVSPEETARAILALAIGLRITELHLKKDPEQLKRIWLDSVSRLLSLKEDVA